MKFALFHVTWICWAALYSNHHYGIVAFVCVVLAMLMMLLLIGVDAIGGVLVVLLVHYCMIRVYSPFEFDHLRQRCLSLTSFDAENEHIQFCRTRWFKTGYVVWLIISRE